MNTNLNDFILELLEDDELKEKWEKSENEYRKAKEKILDCLSEN